MFLRIACVIPLSRDHKCPKTVSVSPEGKKPFNLFSIAEAEAAFFYKIPKEYLETSPVWLDYKTNTLFRARRRTLLTPKK